MNPILLLLLDQRDRLYRTSERYWKMGRTNYRRKKGCALLVLNLSDRSNNHFKLPAEQRELSVSLISPYSLVTLTDEGPGKMKRQNVQLTTTSCLFEFRPSVLWESRQCRETYSGWTLLLTHCPWAFLGSKISANRLAVGYKKAVSWGNYSLSRSCFVIYFAETIEHWIYFQNETSLRHSNRSCCTRCCCSGIIF